MTGGSWQGARFAAALGRDRARTAVHALVYRDPIARLRLNPAGYDPFALYERLRARGPWTRTLAGDLVTTSFAACHDILRDRRFGVQDGVVDPAQAGLDLSFLERDPPDHTRLRRMAAPAFTARAIAAYAPRIEAVAGRLLGAARARGRFDLVDDFAAPLPVAVISDLLGIPAGERGSLAAHGAAVASALDGVRSVGQARALMAAGRALDDMFGRVIRQRRAQPADDLISSLATGPLDDDELRAMCWLLLVAGFETTVNLIGNGTLALLDHPDQWQLLRSDPARAAGVVEETLRYDPPVHRTGRVAHEPAEVAGVRFAAGQWAILLLAAANRDPDLCAEPLRFDITRARADHLAFSSGIHYCLGAPLARLEAEIAFRALATELPGLRRAGRVQRRATITIRGPRHLPVAA